MVPKWRSCSCSSGVKSGILPPIRLLNDEQRAEAMALLPPTLGRSRNADAITLKTLAGVSANERERQRSLPGTLPLLLTPGG